MSEILAAFNSTSIGHNHIRKGKVCEDSSASYSSETMAIAVVADGHGSDNYPRTDRGSRFAVQAALNCVKEFIDTINPEDLLQEKLQSSIFEQLSKSILSSWHTSVEDDFSNDPLMVSELEAVAEKYKKSYINGERIAKAYGSTLIVAGATKNYWFGLHIGDGKCIAVDTEGDFIQPIPWDENCQSNVTTSICDSDAADEFRYYVSAKLPMAVFIGTDGIDDSYSGEQDLCAFYRSVLTIFGEYGYDVGCKEVEEYLPTLSKRGSGDDVSLAAIIAPEEVKCSLSLLKAQTEYANALSTKIRAERAVILTKERIEMATTAVEKGTKMIGNAKILCTDADAKLEKAKQDYETAQKDYLDAGDSLKIATQTLERIKNTVAIEPKVHNSIYVGVEMTDAYSIESDLEDVGSTNEFSSVSAEIKSTDELEKPDQKLE